MKQFVIAARVANQAGVLTRVSGMFTRRGFNIDSLTVGETETSAFSRITISMRGTENDRDQIVKQLRKLYEVREVQVLAHDEAVFRELLLIKVRNDAATRQDILAAVDVFRSKIIDYAPDSLCIELTGESNKINAFIDLVAPCGILEMCRTGIVALERGSHCLRTEEDA